MGKRMGAFGYLAELGAELDAAESSIQLTEMILRIRDKNGRIQPLKANQAQRLFEQRRGRCNVVLKARQMGITTWVAGRFFLLCSASCGGCGSRCRRSFGTMGCDCARIMSARWCLRRQGVSSVWRARPM